MEIVLGIFCIVAIILIVMGFFYQKSFDKKYKIVNSDYRDNKFLSRELGNHPKSKKISIYDVHICKNINSNFITRECGK